jgi:hypothetical protein
VFNPRKGHHLPSPCLSRSPLTVPRPHRKLVWLFDLDNTLHDASHAIFPAISANMNAYIARVLHDGVNAVTQERIDAATGSATAPPCSA